MLKWLFGDQSESQKDSDARGSAAIEPPPPPSEGLLPPILKALGTNPDRAPKSLRSLVSSLPRTAQLLAGLRSLQRLRELVADRSEDPECAKAGQALSYGVAFVEEELFGGSAGSVVFPPDFTKARDDRSKAFRFAVEQAISHFSIARLTESRDNDDRAHSLALGMLYVADAVGVLDSALARRSAWADLCDLTAAAYHAKAGKWPKRKLRTDLLGPLWPEIAEPNQEQAMGAAHPGLRSDFISCLREHRNRMLAVGHPDEDFIEQQLTDEAFKEIAEFATDKMSLTLTDNKSHSVLIAGPAMSVALLTLCGSTAEAARWFEREWGGYTVMLERFLANDDVAACGGEVLCHITYGRDNDTPWVNLSLVPLQSDRFRKSPIFASDLLCDADREKLSAIEEH